MGVGDENVRDGFAAHRVEQRRHMGVVVGAGIEDRHLATADDVADGTLEGERTGIVGGDRTHQWRHLFHRVGLEIERLVERDVVGHAHTLLKWAAMMCTARARRASKPRFRHPEVRAQRASKGDGPGASAGILRGPRSAQAPQDDGTKVRGVHKIMEPPVPGSPGAPATSFNTTSETEIAPWCYANRGPSRAKFRTRRIRGDLVSSYRSGAWRGRAAGGRWLFCRQRPAQN